MKSLHRNYNTVCERKYVIRTLSTYLNNLTILRLGYFYCTWYGLIMLHLQILSVVSNKY